MESAKFRALVYADIFDYPLTAVELEKWKIVGKQLLTANLAREGASSAYQLLTANKDGYYFLKGREYIVSLREKRQEISQVKLKKAQTASDLLKRIPFVQMVALTGGAAMQNSKISDDIDILIIARKGTLWLTRLLSTLFADLKGIRRKPNDKRVNNKICLNMFMEDGYLTLPQRERDLYGAHEVYQIKPLFDKDGVYVRFLKANYWARKFLPNAVSGSKYQVLNIKKGQQNTFYILEWFAKLLQLLYMKQKRTTEVIAPHIVRFHPKDYRSKVLREYEKRLKQHAI